MRKDEMRKGRVYRMKDEGGGREGEGEGGRGGGGGGGRGA
jgi:hypothetical protein